MSLESFGFKKTNTTGRTKRARTSDDDTQQPEPAKRLATASDDRTPVEARSRQAERGSIESELERAGSAWHRAVMKDRAARDGLAKVTAFLAGVRCYPPPPLFFSALWGMSPSEVKVVILGQDPYHGPGQAHGLAFSVLPPVPPPPSLVNMYKEIAASVDPPPPIVNHGHLGAWRAQGVLLLNATLSVAPSQAGSHRGKGWEEVTDALIRAVVQAAPPGVVFLLWGKPAQQKAKLVPRSSGHHVLKAPHPSPLSAYRGFHGCGHFVEANRLLVASGRTAVDWALPSEATAFLLTEPPAKATVVID